MKTIFRIFSKVWFLSFMAIFSSLVALLWLIIGLYQLLQLGLIDFINIHWNGMIIYAGFLLIVIWLLTCTIFPVIKISSSGISAYSIFWTRHLKWKDVRTISLVKMSTRGSGHSSFSSTSVSFEHTLEPETKNIAFLNKGIRVNTFIVVSTNNFQIPIDLSLGLQLTTHRKITSEREIAFQYEEKAWEMIQKQLKQTKN